MGVFQHLLASSTYIYFRHANACEYCIHTHTPSYLTDKTHKKMYILFNKSRTIVKMKLLLCEIIGYQCDLIIIVLSILNNSCLVVNSFRYTRHFRYEPPIILLFITLLLFLISFPDFSNINDIRRSTAS